MIKQFKILRVRFLYISNKTSGDRYKKLVVSYKRKGYWKSKSFEVYSSVKPF